MSGDVMPPRGWQSLRLKDLCLGQPQYGTNIGADAYSDAGLRFIRTTDIDGRGRLSPDGVFISPELADERLCDGDLLLSRSGTIGRSFLYRHDVHGPCSYAGYLVRLRFRDLSAARFVFWFTKSSRFFAQIEADAVESTIANFNGQKYAALRLLIPRDPVQRDSIAAHLERETAKIDALIAKQEAAIGLLRNRREAEIARATSAGRSVRVKHVSTLITSGPRGWSDMITTDGDFFIQSGDLNHDMGLDLEAAKRIVAPNNAEASRSILRDDDAVVCITGANTGRVAHARKLLGRAYINQHLALIRPSQSCAIGRYISYALKSPSGRSYFDACQYGLKEGLSLGDVSNAPLCVPDVAEQVRIVAELDEHQELFVSASTKARQMVDLLTEHRSALITAAVTGQIEVAANIAAEAAA